MSKTLFGTDHRAFFLCLRCNEKIKQGEIYCPKHEKETAIEYRRMRSARGIL